jgi:hypothetical protein
MTLSLDDISMHVEIRQALAIYAHAVDHGDPNAALSVYWPEATDNHGNVWKGDGHEFIRWLIGMYATAREGGFPATGALHHVTSIIVSRTSDITAKVQSYFLAYVPGTSDDAYVVNHMQGRFLDIFEKRGDEWRIIERTVVSDYTSVDVIGESWAAGSSQHGGFAAGGFGPTDPGVALLEG